MSEKVLTFKFSLSGITQEQAAELLGQIAEWAVANNAQLDAGFSPAGVPTTSPTTVVAATFLDP